MTLHIENLSKKYLNSFVLNDISFSITEPSIFCILGANGAGKSTLFNLILGLLKESSGTISINGFSKINNELRRKIGFVIEDDYLLGEINSLEYLRFVGNIYKVNSLILEERINSLLNLFHIGISDASLPIAKYSTGMRSILKFMASVIHNPELLILDEPFKGVDADNLQKIKEIIKLKFNENKTIIYSTHDLSIPFEISTHIGFLNNGSIKVYSKSEFISKVTDYNRDIVNKKILDIL